ncbi:nicotinate (nicotinamide) nucleotide adenylyltransferase [Alteromonas sp. ALT199]|uniref:nicotinate (nicotinamide) nucleotide adenylyltransferase n=1 Tax=unclassified Alteromonas TaxID=2614992 RepID=UPI001BECF0C7|nr:nicotinate (nicotinamide) nucleotide adenylyltransferase [Alteromonas sp. ALT199]MBT3135627.1 nicotinate (nicotinamide) nucleotide adenylyltransferase [Alteromonas sp. ALT199]
MSNSRSSHSSSRVKAILGGTFNPPHKGHIGAALKAADEVGIERVHLMPCKLAPHKSVGVSESHRVKMIELCAQNNDRLIPELIELTLQSPSYTVKTLRALKEKNDDTICFFIGADSLYNLDKWYEWEQLLDYCHLVVMRRDDEKFSPPPAIQAWLDCHVTNDKNIIHAKPAGHVVLTNTPLYSVSSTEIRDVLANVATSNRADAPNASMANSTRLWLEESVLAYINEHQLYKS